jgi:sugar O-acyltransferase (sialic acid O-acetyltransferase NeuD family)
MKKAGIIGFGDLGRQIYNFLIQAGIYREEDFVFFDDPAYSQDRKDAFPFSEYKNREAGTLSFYVGLGYKHLPLRLSLVRELLAAGHQVPAFVHATSFVNPSARVGDGTYIYPMCNVDQQVSIGEGSILNNSVVVSHDCRVGAGSFLAPAVVLSGNVTTGSNCFLGTGTKVSNGVLLGNGVFTAAGSVIIRNYGDGIFVAGSPAKPLKRPFRLM